MINKILHALCWIIVGMLITIGFIWLGIEADQKEKRASEEIRGSRCAKFGETTPPEFKGYCDGLGV